MTYRITRECLVKTIRAVTKGDDYIVDSSVRFSDDFVKAMLARNIIVDNYPDLSQLARFGRPKMSMHIQTKEPIELDGGNIGKHHIITVSGPATIRNVRGLKELKNIASIPVDIIIDNCPNLKEISAIDIKHLDINRNHKKEIELYAYSVQTMQVPKTLVYNSVHLGNNVYLLPKKRFESLFSLYIVITSLEELNRCDPDAFNVNRLTIVTTVTKRDGFWADRTKETLPEIDMTRFDFSNVTTLEIIGDPDVLVFDKDSFGSLISWTSKPLTKISVPDSPSLMYLFITGSKFEEVKKKVYEHANLYIRGLYRGKLKMDIRKSHLNNEDALVIDIVELLEVAENTQKSVPKSSAKMQCESLGLTPIDL